jgi:predicted Na+-dependent transporter
MLAALSLSFPIILISLSNRRLMLRALLFNFVLVPRLASAATQLIAPDGLELGCPAVAGSSSLLYD